jgi:glycerol uptake facilitator-like aquaporin
VLKILHFEIFSNYIFKVKASLISGFWEFHWLYWAAPILGGIIAGLIMNYVFVKSVEKEA